MFVIISAGWFDPAETTP